MKDKKYIVHLVVFLVGIIIGLLFCDITSLHSRVEYKTVTDTVVKIEKVRHDSLIPDTVIYTLYKWKVKPYYIKNDSLVHDTILIEVPIEYHIASKQDTFDIYYHGAYSGIDSVLIYNQTKFITTTKFVESSKNLIQLRVSNLATSVSYSRRLKSFYLGGGVGITYSKQPEVNLNLGYSF